MDREKIYIFFKVEKEGKLRERGFEGRGKGGDTSLGQQRLMNRGLMLGRRPRDACRDNCCGHMSREPLISLSVSSVGCSQGDT